MLTQNQIAQEISKRTGVKVNLVKNVLATLGGVADDELAAGNDVNVANIVRINWKYRKPQKKGDRWKKGEEVTGFGGNVSVKDSDSPPVKARVTLAGSIMPATKKAASLPKSTDEAQQAEFLKTKAGKAIAKRKG